MFPSERGATLRPVPGWGLGHLLLKPPSLHSGRGTEWEASESPLPAHSTVPQTSRAAPLRLLGAGVG